jgi:diguanylate cyclase (GGDEF)-like protein/PAS domain S-box-containing protein
VDDTIRIAADDGHWLRALFESVPIAVVVEDLQGCIKSWNPQAERLFGWRADEIVGHALPFGPDADRIIAERRYQRALEGERIEQADLECVRSDGARFSSAVLAMPLYDRDGRVFGVLSMYSDMSALKRAEGHTILQSVITRSLSDAETATAAVARAIQSFCGLAGWVCGVHWHLDPSDGLLRCGETWHLPNRGQLSALAATLAKAELGSQDAHTLARKVMVKGAPLWEEDLDAQPDAAFAAALREAGIRSAFAFPIRVDGEAVGVMELYATEQRPVDRDLLRIAGQLGGLIGQHIARRETERRLQFVVSHDPLTGLPNRTIFTQRLSQAIAQAARYEHKVGLLFVDLDGFKIVNDTMGHEAGDRLLREVADRLRESLREGDTVGRYGGDEFVVLIEQYDPSMQVEGVAQKILDQVATPFLLDGHEFQISASIGIATYPNDGQDGAALLKHADIAMYRAKEAGKNQYQFYSPHMNRLSQERLELESALRLALERGDFRLLYQPCFDTEGRHVLGLEALLRWRQAALLVSPADFLPLAEETGLAVPIGEWVLRTACAQARAWQERGRQPVRMSVNVSPRHFAHGNLVACVEDTLRETRLDAALLQLEVREPMLVQNAERAQRILRSLKDLGVSVALDDFGTCASALDTLRRFPLDCVKLDRSFVAGIPQAPEAVGSARAVIAMAHSFGLRAAAEGVETEEQARFLRIQGCDEMQGFLFGKVVSADEIIHLLDRSMLRA